MTPLQAIKNNSELSLKRKKDSRILSLFFGIEGELAGNAVKAQRKALRTATLSLTFSFLAFSFMMCFLTVMVISQRETYFEKYQDAWDIMAEIKSTNINDFTEIRTLQESPEVQNVTAYQKANAKRVVTQEEISGELLAIGGFAGAPAQYVSEVDGGWLVNAPLIIMDDASFLEYCIKIGAKPRLDGAVILNKTLDSTDPNFRERRVLPYLMENCETTVLKQSGQEDAAAEIPVLAYTQTVPILREEYGTLDFYELTHFIPASLWKSLKGQVGDAESNTIIRILAGDEVTLERLNQIETRIVQFLSPAYQIEIENRIQDKINNDKMIRGMKTVVSVFCILLAVIGIGSVFPHTLGFVRQRKREFARYISIGMTPKGIRKIFCIEALVIAGKPALITFPITAAAIAWFIKISYLEPMLFIREIPFIPILGFLLSILGFVGLAYYIGAKKILRSNIIDSLQDDTVM